MKKEMSRRSFLKAGTAAAIGMSMTPGSMFAGVDAKKKKKGAKDGKLKILGVGIGGPVVGLTPRHGACQQMVVIVSLNAVA